MNKEFKQQQQPLPAFPLMYTSLVVLLTITHAHPPTHTHMLILDYTSLTQNPKATIRRRRNKELPVCTVKSFYPPPSPYPFLAPNGHDKGIKGHVSSCCPFSSPPGSSDILQVVPCTWSGGADLGRWDVFWRRMANFSTRPSTPCKDCHPSTRGCGKP